MTAKINTGLRLDPDTLARVNAYLDRLRREPGRSGATLQDAFRTLIDHGLVSVDEPAFAAKPSQRKGRR